MIRKILLIALACLMVMGFAACGEGEATYDPTDSPSATPEQIVITLQPQAGANEIYQLTQKSQIMTWSTPYVINNPVRAMDAPDLVKPFVAIISTITAE